MATINDIVLIHLEDSPVSFARVESILPDHKKDWYQIKLLMLQIPLQVVTWILKDAYINGEDFFMNGKKMRLDVVECPAEELGSAQIETLPSRKNAPTDNATDNAPTDGELSDADETPDEQKGKIISFASLKNNKNDPDPEIG